MKKDSVTNTHVESTLNRSGYDQADDAIKEVKQDNKLLTLLDVSVVSTSEEFKSLKQSWNKLNNKSHNGTIFISWEWLYTWWEIYKNDGDRKLYILCCHDHKHELIGIAPFQQIYNPKRYFPSNQQILFIGTGETDGSQVFGEYMDLLIKPGHESSVINVFSEFLYKRKSTWDGLKFQQLLNNSHLSKLFKNQPNKIISKVTPYGVRTIIELPETYSKYLMSLRKKMRNNITRTFSRLESEQKFTFEHITKSKDIERSIATLAELNRGRRGDLNQSSVFQYKNFENFHKLLSKRLLPLNSVRLCILRFDNLPVAALYSFLDGNTLHVYQSGFVKEHGHRYSLLTTMLTQEISSSIDDEAIDYFNFMFSESEDTYKHRYSSETDPMYNLSFDKKGMKHSLYVLLHKKLKNSLKKLIK
ncbi:hypothetical protein GQR58_010582 [Nymphon striatum]|nr:hypothetical protein GQR58_010582 [Nymphon striatum]